MQKFQAK
jgi:four helix bundle protein